jgi:hypothetical protein
MQKPTDTDYKMTPGWDHSELESSEHLALSVGRAMLYAQELPVAALMAKS